VAPLDLDGRSASAAIGAAVDHFTESFVTRGRTRADELSRAVR
jgi:hypothetical protein